MASSKTNPQRLHVIFLPFMAAGHMIPTLEIAKLFAANHVKTTIVTTPLNAPTFLKPLQCYKNNSPQIDIKITPFPSKEAGFPEGIENLEQVHPEMSFDFLKAIQLVEEPLVQILAKCDPKPSCLVADFLFPFATDVATKFNIPRLVFHASCTFTLSVMDVLRKYKPHKSILNCDEEFVVIPNLPHEIKMTKTALSNEIENTEWTTFFRKASKSETNSYGVVVNSFYELEPDYVEYYRKVVGRKLCPIGPTALWNREKESYSQRGKDSSIDEFECLKWLDSKKVNSVVYICFGSLAQVSPSQLHEIAKGLEASEQDFIWVVSKNKDGQEKEAWLPEGFEQRVKGKGLIIRGWAPQVMILNHEAIGGFMTHCGWNSVLESISYGVPMVTWPMFADHPFNEKLVTDVLKTGIAVGAKKRGRIVECSVTCEDMKKVIKRLMVGDEALGLRCRVKKLKEMAWKAVGEGGSSYSELCSLIEELSNYAA